MTSRKSAQPVEVTQPAIPADVAFANIVNDKRDAAINAETALSSQKAARIGQFERDLERIHALYDADIASLDAQLAQQAHIINAADAALMSLTEASKPSNVVAMAAE